MADQRNHDERSKAGCAWSMLGLNALAMGLTALSFSQGPYSSWEQELGYRYYSISFVLVGAVLPGIALLSPVRRWAWTPALLTAWMITTFIAFLAYITLAQGGI